jgi:hypothetical protein
MGRACRLGLVNEHASGCAWRDNELVTVLVVLVGLMPFFAVLGVLLWAIRRQDRMFPKGFDRTGWNPDPDRAGWFLTKFTWLSGGRGGS